jgi:hypothetical protein
VPGVSDDFGNADNAEFSGVVPVISPDIEIPGVDDGEGQEDPAPQEIEIADLEIESDPAPIEVETVQEETAEVAPVIEPMQLPGPWRSGQVKTQTKTGLSSEHDRFEAFSRRHSARETRSASSRCTHVCAGRFLPIRS